MPPLFIPPLLPAALAVVMGIIGASTVQGPGVRSGGSDERLLCTRLADGDVISAPHGYLITTRGEFVMYEEAALSGDATSWFCPLAPRERRLLLPREMLF